MSFVVSSNMNLPVPVVGQEAGPSYAVDINTCMALIDSHTHVSGQGVQITPSGININSALAFNNNFLTTVAGTTFTAQISSPNNGTTYVSGVDLHYVDLNGIDIALTNNGGVAGTNGSIAGLAPPASATYNSLAQTFTWQSGTNLAAIMDMGDIFLRNLSPNSTFALNLRPPAALAADYALTLPHVPASETFAEGRFVTVDHTGIMVASVQPDNSTLTIASSLLKVPAGGITTTQILNNTIVDGDIANLTITAASIANATITNAKLAAGVLNTINLGIDISSFADFATGATATGPIVVAASSTLTIAANRTVRIIVRPQNFATYDLTATGLTTNTNNPSPAFYIQGPDVNNSYVKIQIQTNGGGFIDLNTFTCSTAAGSGGNVGRLTFGELSTTFFQGSSVTLDVRIVVHGVGFPFNTSWDAGTLCVVQS